MSLVHLRVAERDLVGAGVVVLLGRDIRRAQRALRAFGDRAAPGIHHHAGIDAMLQRLTEQGARRLVLDGDLHAGRLPLALQHLLLQLAQAVAGGGAELDRQRLAGGVAADPVAARLPAGLRQQRLRLGGIIRVGRNVLAVVRLERIDPGGGDRLLPLEQLLHHRLAIDRHQQRLAHAQVGQDRVVLLQIDVLVGQARLEDVVELVGMLLLQRDHLVDGEADALAVHHVHVARQQVRLQCGGVVDQLDDDVLEAGLGPAQYGFGSSTICVPD